jgi:hypothetical protein
MAGPVNTPDKAISGILSDRVAKVVEIGVGDHLLS